MYTSLSSLVGRQVTFTPEHDDTHQGTVRAATWNTAGEPVVVIHADETRAHLGTDYVMVGRDAATIIDTLESSAA